MRNVSAPEFGWELYHFFLKPDTDKIYPGNSDQLTVCVLVLWNGHVVVGYAIPVDPYTYDEEKGRQLAYADAQAKARPLLDYERQTKACGSIST